MVGVSFGHSLGLAVLSPLVGAAYDRIGFAHTYLLIGAFATVFWIWSARVLAPTPPEVCRAARVADSDSLTAGA
jgi:OHS family lactose permease-like MFS transporter